MNHETLSLALALTMARINGRHTKGEWQKTRSELERIVRGLGCEGRG